MTNSTPSALTRTIASIVRGLMARHSVTQAELAQAIGVSQSQLSKMVRGVKPIEIDQLDGMVTALGGNTWAIIKEAEDVLGDLDPDYNTEIIFVDEDLKLPDAWVTGGRHGSDG